MGDTRDLQHCVDSAWAVREFSGALHRRIILWETAIRNGDSKGTDTLAASAADLANMLLAVDRMAARS